LGLWALLDPRLGMVREYDKIKNMSKNYVLIFLKNTGATAKWVFLTLPPTKRVTLTLPHLISEYHYISFQLFFQHMARNKKYVDIY
jgi:hypothetical protein